MTATLVRSAQWAQNTGLATVPASTAALGGTASAGNLLIASIGADDYITGGSSQNRTPPSGWTFVTNGQQESNLGHYLLFKVAAGTETGITYTIGSASPSCGWIAEWSGMTASPADGGAGQKVVASANSYTTPTLTPTAGDRLLIGTIGGSLSTANFIGGMGSWLSSFIEDQDAKTTFASGTRDSVGGAWLTVTANGSTAYSTGATWDGGDTPQSRTGIIAAFKVAAAATSSAPELLVTQQAVKRAAYI